MHNSLSWADTNGAMARIWLPMTSMEGWHEKQRQNHGCCLYDDVVCRSSIWVADAAMKKIPQTEIVKMVSLKLFVLAPRL